MIPSQNRKLSSPEIAPSVPQNTETLNDAGLERRVLTQMMRLNEAITGVVTGLIVGITILIATNWLVLKGGTVIGPHLILLGQFFIGYQVTFWGSLIGCGYGFALGFVAGFSTCKMYNWLVGIRERARRSLF